MSRFSVVVTDSCRLTLALVCALACSTAKISKKASHSDSRHFELKTFTYKPRSPSSAEQDFSTAKRIAHDTKQTLKLAESLDEEYGRTDMSDSISVLLTEPQVSRQVWQDSSSVAMPLVTNIKCACSTSTLSGFDSRTRLTAIEVF